MDAVANAWKDIDWERLQARIETEIGALGERQDDSEERRKRLVDESNSYRERTNKESRKLAVPLIKAFQQEFDGLIARSQSAESALIDICSQITNLPDPKIVLQSAEAWKSDAEKTKRAIEEREELKKQLQSTQKELAELRNQDVEIRKLKGEIVKRENEQEKLLEESCEEVEKRIRNELEQQFDEMNLRNEKSKAENEMLEKKMNDLEAKYREVQRKLDVAKMANDQREALESEQLAIAVKDVQEANHKIVCLEETIEQLNKEIEEKSKVSKPNDGIEGIAAFGGIMMEKDEQLNRVLEEMKEMEKKHAAEAKQWREKLAQMEKDHAKQASIIEELKAQLESRNDYDAIKKELRLLREIEFGSSCDDSEHFGETVETLDRLLAEKNRRLQNENASLRVLNETYKGDSSDVSSRIKSEIGNGQKASSSLMEDELDEASIDLLSILRKIKGESGDEPIKSEKKRGAANGSEEPLVKHIKLPTHTITTTALPYNGGKYSERSVSPSFSDEYDLKLASNADEKPVEEKTIATMQARIQENVRNLGNRPLNTHEIAKQCKKLMVAYNIGQRLFAKHVMNQVVKSQGSLSELLSKPRHWSKLTDKGREAFRRIYGWISDDTAIDLLCSLSPRRVWPTEQKVEHPVPESMWDCNSAQIVDAVPPPLEETPKKPTSAREDQYRLAGTGQAANAGTSKNSNCGIGGQVRTSRWRHDDISKEKIMSIFQTELAKLKEQESNIEKAISGKMFSPTARRLSASSSDSSSFDPQAKIIGRLNSVDKVMRSRISSGLVPLTQQQYDTYPSLDTDQLVRQIKEFLTVNCISQRQFGEHVLGLSQGSVSDLLARPKSWAQLTQKGREPFIRMKLFMDDVEAMENGDGMEEEEEMEEDEDQGIIEPQIRVLGDDSELAKTLASILNGCGNGEPSDVMIKEEPVCELDLMMKMESTSEIDSLTLYLDQNGREVLDTFEIIKKVKKMLDENGVSYRMFGDYYLKCNPTVCADMFWRTKSFENSKPVEREIYSRMKEFLTDREGMIMLVQKEAMKALPKERSNSNSACLKRKPSTDSEENEPIIKKPIQRTIITDFQKDTLRFVFINESHPSNEMCEMLAHKLDMSLRTVQNWFHNHRTRTKAREREGKVYVDALPTDGNATKSANWKKELDEMLSRAPTAYSNNKNLDKWFTDLVDTRDAAPNTNNNNNNGGKKPPKVVVDSPTMVNIISSSVAPRVALPNVLNIHGKVSSTSGAVGGPLLSIKKPATSGQLDKLVAKMRQLAEGKSKAN